MENHLPSESDRGEREYLLAQTTISLAVVVVAIKSGKLLFLFLNEGFKGRLNDLNAWGSTGNALRLIGSLWLIRCLLAIIIGAACARVIRRRYRWAIWFLPLVAIGATKLIEAAYRHDLPTAYFWILEATEQLAITVSLLISVLRSDLLFLAGFFILSYAAIMAVPGRYLPTLRGILALCVGLLLALAGLDLVYYSKTGISGTGRLLEFFLTNTVNLVTMFRGQIDALSIAALLAPLLAGVLTALLVRRRFNPSRVPSNRRLARLLPFALGSVVVGAFVRPLPPDHRYDHLVPDTSLSLADLVRWRGAEELDAMKRVSRLPALPDTSSVTLERVSAESATPRNVIIIMVESARAKSTSIYDPAIASTPFLAELGKRGAVVSDMYAVIPRTSAAWVSTLHGIWPSPDDEITTWARSQQQRLQSLPKLLAGRGYVSAFFTSSHLTFGYDDPLIKNMGFGSVHYPDTLPHAGFQNPTFWGFEDRIMVGPSVEWVRQQRDGGKPFLLVMMTDTTHYDYRYPTSWPALRLGDRDAAYDRYLNCLRYTDSWIKEFLGRLDQMGILHSTVVLVLGDHGESFGEHGAQGRSLLVYEESLRIPTIVYAEDLIRPGTLISGLREEIDVAPTIFDALGLTMSGAALPGVSLLKPVSPERRLYFAATLDSYALATRRRELKFIYNFDRAPTEVYDIDRDPEESHDLARTLPAATIHDAEMDMLVWRERAQRQYLSESARVVK